MPIKPKRPCSRPGCPNFATHGAYCEKHKKAERKRYDSYRPSFRERGYTTQWDKVRAIKIRQDPICEECKRVKATLVHHIIPVSERPDLLLVMDNLESLCVQCHEKIHGNRFAK